MASKVVSILFIAASTAGSKALKNLLQGPQTQANVRLPGKRRKARGKPALVGPQLKQKRAFQNEYLAVSRTAEAVENSLESILLCRDVRANVAWLAETGVDGRLELGFVTAVDRGIELKRQVNQTDSDALVRIAFSQRVDRASRGPGARDPAERTVSVTP
jgi:hypothetical protein